MGQLCQRIILIHKLGQLGTSKKLLDRRSYRLNINQRLRSNAIHILGSHALSYHPLHTGQTDTVLVLQQLPYGTDTPVA